MKLRHLRFCCTPSLEPINNFKLKKCKTVKFGWLADEFELANDVLNAGIVKDGLEPAVHIPNVLARLVAQNVLVSLKNMYSFDF